MKTDPPNLYENARDASIQQRLGQRVRDIFFRNKIAFGHNRQLRRHATPDQLYRRARKFALRYMRRKLLGGRSYYSLSLGARQDVDNYIDRSRSAIDALTSQFYGHIASAETHRKPGHAYRENISKGGTFSSTQTKSGPPKRIKSKKSTPHKHTDAKTGVTRWT